MDKIYSSTTSPDKSMVYRPVLFRLNNKTDETALKDLLNNNPDIIVYDTISGQLSELIKLSHPQKRLSKEESALLVFSVSISSGETL